MSTVTLSARRLLVISALSLSLMVASGCTDSSSPSTSLPDSATGTRDTPIAPAACEAGAVKDTAEQFLAALNKGDAAAADAAVATEPRFQWFAVNPERVDLEASDRTTLRGFFDAQVAARQHIELIEYGFSRLPQGGPDRKLRIPTCPVQQH